MLRRACRGGEAVHVGIEHSDVVAAFSEGHGQVYRHRRLSYPALARADTDDPGPALGPERVGPSFLVPEGTVLVGVAVGRRQRPTPPDPGHRARRSPSWPGPRRAPPGSSPSGRPARREPVEGNRSSRTRRVTSSRSGHPATVRATVTVTRLRRTSTARTMPMSTMLTFSSGSVTGRRASMTCCSLTTKRRPASSRGRVRPGEAGDFSSLGS